MGVDMHRTGMRRNGWSGTAARATGCIALLVVALGSAGCAGGSCGSYYGGSWGGSCQNYGYGYNSGYCSGSGFACSSGDDALFLLGGMAVVAAVVGIAELFKHIFDCW